MYRRLWGHILKCSNSKSQSQVLKARVTARRPWGVWWVQFPSGDQCGQRFSGKPWEEQPRMSQASQLLTILLFCNWIGENKTKLNLLLHKSFRFIAEFKHSFKKLRTKLIYNHLPEKVKLCTAWPLHKQFFQKQRQTQCHTEQGGGILGEHI